MQSRFITLLLLALMASSVHAVIALIAADAGIERLAWAGSLLATGSFLGFFLWLTRVSLTPRHPPGPWRRHVGRRRGQDHPRHRRPGAAGARSFPAARRVLHQLG